MDDETRSAALPRWRSAGTFSSTENLPLIKKRSGHFFYFIEYDSFRSGAESDAKQGVPCVSHRRPSLW
ncbi:hypothetical protein J8J19_24000, partial [Mycobacterium tuberculosis]|nr:hypothetical protein [Mycobacterium tuberculosis]